MSIEEAEALKNEGNAALKANNLDLAIEKYTKAIELNPNNAIYYSNRAHVDIKLENYGSAIIDSTKAISVDPSYLKAYYRRAIANNNLFKHKLAVQDLNIILSKKPNDQAAQTLKTEISKVIRRLAFEKAIEVQDEDIFAEINYENFKIEQDYEGPTLDIKQLETGDIEFTNLNDEWIKDLVKYFKSLKSGALIPKKYLYALFLKMNNILDNEPTFKEVSMAPTGVKSIDGVSDVIHNKGKFTIVGDVHGQFYDLVNYFETNGYPSSTNSYLFNGDFVDRGSWSAEVIILLFFLKALYPDNLHLNRGNHESVDMNKMYGFEDEIKYKYGEGSYKYFTQLFIKLPLITLLNNDYLVMHGGLFSKPDVKLTELKKKLLKLGNPKEGLEMEILWTDPQDEDGYSASKRGIGVQFGPDITEKFCALNNLKGVIRSHEVRMEGYSKQHNGKLITIFSAPNYCDSTGNKGALIHVEYTNGETELTFTQYQAAEHPDIRPMAYTTNRMY
ncbi:hypothetical protein WICPIJ_002707 [Wickerhamomyces pijperi]|uniref:Serine/threonine-protein phosphatase n=1 Tax=Wickerhamomyces pijperi TaxID=599730 RepID=A0A9P8TPK9_WICPI|nr:hypothetical protein WICPIJ_002707 [Wickerhamomyces pijperi]